MSVGLGGEKDDTGIGLPCLRRRDVSVSVTSEDQPTATAADAAVDVTPVAPSFLEHSVSNDLGAIVLMSAAQNPSALAWAIGTASLPDSVREQADVAQ